MTARCPKCREDTLAPFSEGRDVRTGSLLPPSRCPRCGGVWMPHEAIHEGAMPTATPESPATISENGDGRAGFCPNGHGYLVRASVEAEPPFYLERCGTCTGVWFDAGEWAAIASSEWLKHLDDLWDPIFRRKMREARVHQKHLETLEHALGAEVYQKVIAATDALRDHPMKSLAVAFILDEMRTRS